MIRILSVVIFLIMIVVCLRYLPTVWPNIQGPIRHNGVMQSLDNSGIPDMFKEMSRPKLTPTTQHKLARTAQFWEKKQNDLVKSVQTTTHKVTKTVDTWKQPHHS